jgi:hypothetical protein
MTIKLSASVCRCRTLTSVEESEEYQAIMIKISDAVNAGEFFVKLDYLVDHAIELTLESNGFRIEYWFNGSDSKLTRISWVK